MPPFSRLRAASVLNESYRESRRPLVEMDRWWENLPAHAPKDALGEVMKMKVKDGDIIIMRVPRNFSKMAIEHHAKSIRKALKERKINASIAVVLKEVDIGIISTDGENILGVNMKIE